MDQVQLTSAAPDQSDQALSAKLSRLVATPSSDCKVPLGRGKRRKEAMTSLVFFFLASASASLLSAAAKEGQTQQSRHANPPPASSGHQRMVMGLRRIPQGSRAHDAIIATDRAIFVPENSCARPAPRSRPFPDLSSLYTLF